MQYYKKYMPIYEPLVIIPFTESKWNFVLKYFEVCGWEPYKKHHLNCNNWSYSDNMSKISNDNTYFFTECYHHSEHI